MQELDFRRRRKSQQKRPRRQPHGNELRFGGKSRKLHFERKKGRVTAAAKRRVLAWAVQITAVCALAFGLVTFFGQRVSNAGDSMSPTLENGEVVLINRIIYDIRQPERGEVVAFCPDGNENVHYSLKRVVGLPGETVQIKDGSVYVNDRKAEKDIFVTDIDYAGIAGEPVTLGKDEYFVIGDNAGFSDDSRTETVGNVSKDDICGKAWFTASFTENFGFIKD